MKDKMTDAHTAATSSITFVSSTDYPGRFKSETRGKTQTWIVSQLVITCVSVIIAVNSFTGDRLPDALTRVLGVLDLVAVVVLTYFQ